MIAENYQFQEGQPPNQKDVILGQRVNVSCRIRIDNGVVPHIDWFLRVNNVPQNVTRILPNDTHSKSKLPNVYQVTFMPSAYPFL